MGTVASMDWPYCLCIAGADRAHQFAMEADGKPILCARVGPNRLAGKRSAVYRVPSTRRDSRGAT